MTPERKAYAEKRVIKLTAKIDALKAAREKFIQEERWTKQFAIDYDKAMKSSVSSRKRWQKELNNG